MAIYKLEDLLKKHNVTQDQVTSFGSEQSIQNSLQELEKKQEPTFAGKILRETVRPLANVATNVVNAGQIALGKEETQPFSGEYLGEVEGLGKLDMTKGFTPENIKVLKDSVKAGVDIGALLAGGGGAGTVAKTGVKQGIIQAAKAGAKTGSIVGGTSGLATGLEEDATLGSTLANTALGAVSGGVVGGVLGGATGSVKPVIGAVKNATTGLQKGAGNVLEKTGQKIQNTVIKPSIRDVKDGFKIENVSKYDVGGSLPETIAKTHTKMNKLSQELTTKLQGAESKLDLNKVYQDTIKSLGGDKALSFGDNSAIERVVKSLDEEIKQVSEDGLVDLVRATNVKRGAGAKGAWAYNRPEADSSAIEKVYTAFYGKLKDEIEKVAPEGVRDINKQISELIPINNAALRRMTVEERNNALSLMDNIGLVSSIFDPKALALFGTNRLLKSGKVGNFLTKSGQKLKATTDTSPKVLPKLKQPQSVKSTYKETIPSTKPKSTSLYTQLKETINAKNKSGVKDIIDDGGNNYRVIYKNNENPTLFNKKYAEENAGIKSIEEFKKAALGKETLYTRIKNTPNKQGGFISFKEVAKKIDTTDRDIIQQYNQEYSSGKVSKETAKRAQNLASAMGLPNMAGTNRALFEDFTQILDADRTINKKKTK